MLKSVAKPLQGAKNGVVFYFAQGCPVEPHLATLAASSGEKAKCRIY